MHLKCLAGAYAGQVRNYSTVAGLAALRTGMAARLDELTPAVAPTPSHSQPAAGTRDGHNTRSAARRRERGQ